MQRAAKIGGGDSAWKLSEVLRSKLAGGMIGRGGESWKRPGEIAPFVDLVELAGAQDRVDDGGAPDGIWMADEEEVFPGDGARPDAIFHGVGVDVHVAVAGLGITGELRPALERIAQRFAEDALGQDSQVSGRSSP